MLATAPQWWTSPPPALNLVLVALSALANARAAWLTRHAGAGRTAKHAAVALLSVFWTVAFALRVTSTISAADYLVLVGPMTPVAFGLVWLLPAINVELVVRSGRRSREAGSG